MPLPRTFEESCHNDSAVRDLPDVKDMTPEELERFVAFTGKEGYRSRQIMKWVYRFGVRSFEEMTDLSKAFRQELKGLARISELEIRKVQTSKDGTKKVLFRLEDGLHVESVLIPGKRHRTLCVSTQAGCRMGCRFCLTGRGGFKRNLRVSEITDQITVCRFRLPEGKEIDNIVMMGMGEPLDNYENVVKAVSVISSDWGLAVSNRKITVSTCGVVPMIERLSNDAQVNLAVSLNATDDKTRANLMPVGRLYPLKDLLGACRKYQMPRRRRITFEYILMDGINSSVGDAEKLAGLLRGLRCKINLIAFNEYPESEFRSPPAEAVEAFRSYLIKKGFTAILRASKGSDILAACGQLSAVERGDGG